MFELDEHLTVEQIAEDAGAELARKLRDAFGGIRLYIPRQPPRSHRLAHALGFDTARRLGELFGGETIVLPRGKSAAERARDRQAILKLRDEGQPPAAIARALGCTERWVYRVLADSRGGGRRGAGKAGGLREPPDPAGRNRASEASGSRSFPSAQRYPGGIPSTPHALARRLRG